MVTQRFILIINLFLAPNSKEVIATPLLERGVQHIGKSKRMNKEFKFRVEIWNCEMNDVILDLGLGFNILPKKSWKQMGKPKLLWSLIQLRLANKYMIYPIG